MFAFSGAVRSLKNGRKRRRHKNELMALKAPRRSNKQTKQINAHKHTYRTRFHIVCFENERRRWYGSHSGWWAFDVQTDIEWEKKEEK